MAANRLSYLFNVVQLGRKYLLAVVKLIFRKIADQNQTAPLPAIRLNMGLMTSACNNYCYKTLELKTWQILQSRSNMSNEKWNTTEKLTISK